MSGGLVRVAWSGSPELAWVHGSAPTLASAALREPQASDGSWHDERVPWTAPTSRIIGTLIFSAVSILR